MKLINAVGLLFTASIGIQDTLAIPQSKQMAALHPRGFHGDDDPIGIVGGEPVGASDKYPWIVALQHPIRGFFCGGSLIAKNLVLTAAHCMVYPITEFSASARRYDISTTSKKEGGIDFEVIRKIVHPKYGRGPVSINSSAFDLIDY
jgi:secreted trypsin-like serine protease